MCVHFQQYYILIEYPNLIMFTVEHNRYTKFILSKDILTTRADIDLLLDIHKLPWFLKNVPNSEIFLFGF